MVNLKRKLLLPVVNLRARRERIRRTKNEGYDSLRVTIKT